MQEIVDAVVPKQRLVRRGTKPPKVPSPLVSATSIPPRGPHEPLSEIAKRLRKRLADIATGETAIAIDVEALADRWNEYRAEANGREFAQWLRDEVDTTRPLSWYRARAEAARKFPDLVDRVDSKALLWLHNNLPKDKIGAVSVELIGMFRANRSIPLKGTQVTGKYRHFSTRSKSRQRIEDEIRDLRARIGRLEAQVRAGCKAGAVPVE